MRILTPAFCEAFGEGSEIVDKIEAGEFEGTSEEAAKEAKKQEVRLSHLRTSWEQAEVLVAILSVEHESLCWGLGREEAPFFGEGLRGRADAQ